MKRYRQSSGNMIEVADGEWVPYRYVYKLRGEIRAAHRKILENRRDFAREIKKRTRYVTTHKEGRLGTVVLHGVEIFAGYVEDCERMEKKIREALRTY